MDHTSNHQTGSDPTPCFLDSTEQWRRQLPYLSLIGLDRKYLRYPPKMAAWWAPRSSRPCWISWQPEQQQVWSEGPVVLRAASAGLLPSDPHRANDVLVIRARLDPPFDAGNQRTGGGSSLPW